MFERLIRPVNSIIEPVNIGCTSCTNRPTFSFPIPSELGVTAIEFNESFNSDSVYVDITEGNRNQSISLLICLIPYKYSNPSFVQADVSLVSRGILELRPKEVLLLPMKDPLSPKYDVEKPRRLCMVEGYNYRFIIGKKKKDVFVDGWLKQAQFPNWRLAIPTAGRTYSTSVVVPSSRLIIFG